VERNIRAREIENEISVETTAQSIETASKAVADTLIKTTEDGPTDLQGTIIAAIVSAQVQAALKKEAAKKETAGNRKATTNLPYTNQRTNTRRKKENGKHSHHKMQAGPAQVDTHSQTQMKHCHNTQHNNGTHPKPKRVPTCNTHKHWRNNSTPT
jgi:hypothetical protein